MVGSNPILVVRRIMDKGKLWGVKIKYQGQYFKMAKERLAEIITHDIKPVTVDMKIGDAPVSLTMYNDSFRTIHDGHLCNNFNKIPSIKLISANKLKVKK